MAESQIAGLFMTPEMYQRQQMQADRQRAAEYAQLAPEQRAAMGFFSAGQGLGRAAGTLLGAQDPQLQRITEQQQMLQGLDVADPDSLMQAARRASEAGNVPLAMQLAQQASQATQARDAAEQRRYQLAQLQDQERQRRLTAAAQGVAQGAVQMSPATIQGLPVSESMPLRDDEGNMMPGAQEAALSLNIEAVAPLLATMGPAGAAALKGLVEARDAMLPKTQVVGRDQRVVDPRTGREIVAAMPKEAPEVKPSAFAQQLIDEGLERGSPEFQRRMRAFNDAKTTGTARGTGTTVVMPPAPTKVPQDVAKFRQDVMKTIEPQLKVVTATDQALSQLELSIKKSNPIAFNAARVQLARAIGGGGDLALKEIQNAGGDPSIAGRILDTTSTLFTSTPTIALQNQIQATLRAFKTVAANKARAELATQRDLAIRSGSSASDVDRALRFSELEQVQAQPASAPAPTGGSSAPSSTFLGSVRPSAQPAQSAPQRNVIVNF